MRKIDGLGAGLIGIAFAVAFLSSAHADPTGTWLTEGGKSRVMIQPCGEKICGKIVWLSESRNADGSEKLDIHNKDESLRERSIMGLELLTDFVAAGDVKWTEGEIYNPEDGKTYRSELELTDSGTLKVTGCVFFFCKTQTWTRVE